MCFGEIVSIVHETEKRSRKSLVTACHRQIQYAEIFNDKFSGIIVSEELRMNLDNATI
jgi:hypothetical protein